MISKKDMKQYRYILMETPEIENRIKRSQKKLEKLESEGNVVDKVSGGEGGNQHFRIEGFPVAEYSREKTRMMQQMLRHEQNMEFLAKQAAAGRRKDKIRADRPPAAVYA